MTFGTGLEFHPAGGASAGLAFIFPVRKPLFKVGVVTDEASVESKPAPARHPFLQTLHVDFYSVPLNTLDVAIRKVGRHQVGYAGFAANQMHYWVNSDSPTGTCWKSCGSGGTPLAKQSVQGEEIRYVDWVVPGILGMNVMSVACLGWVL